MIPKECKRLAEVDFPIAVVSKHSAREKSIRHGHPSTLHLWWARRPLAACRAMLLALLLPDPCHPQCPAEFKKKARALLTKTQGQVDADDMGLRKGLLGFIGDFAAWEHSSHPMYLEVGRGLVKAAHPEETPLVVDPFAGGGSIPLEALRLGCDAFASDLNPVACLINKVMLEDIPRHGPELAEEFRRIGGEIKVASEKELAEFYPPDPDGALPIAYLWARTVKCESPNCGAELPLARSFWLCTKTNRRRALKHKVVRPTGEPPHVKFEVFEPKSEKEVPPGTVTRAKATCICCGAVLPPERVRAQLAQQRGGADAVFNAKGNRAGGARMLAVVTLHPGATGRHYRLPAEREYQTVWKAQKRIKAILDDWERGGKRGLCPVPDESTPAGGGSGAGRAFSVQKYGIMTFADLFTARQKVMLTSLLRLINDSGDIAIRELLALALGKLADKATSLCRWKATAEYMAGNTFSRPALPIVWDFCEAQPFAGASGGWEEENVWILKVVEELVRSTLHPAQVQQADACESPLPSDSATVFFTDPPYYDAIPYSDLSDFFLSWTKRSLPGHPLLRDPFDPSNHLSPKLREAVQDETKEVDGHPKDRVFFESTMARAFAEGCRTLREDGVGSVVFAHKTTEGWEALLSGMIKGGWVITGSWPIATESSSRLRAMESAALATSVHLVCRPRPEDTLTGDWGDVLRELPKRVGDWMERLQEEGVRGADLVFACIGPALEIYSRYSKVEDAEGREVPLGGDPEAKEPYKRGFLAYVWETVGRVALQTILGTAEAKARNSAAGALEEDARLTALFLWALQSTNGDNSHRGGAEDAEEEDEGDGEEEGKGKKAKGKSGGFTLIYDVVRRFAQPLGIHLDVWEDRIIETEKGVVRLLPVAERAEQLFGQAGAALAGDRIEEQAKRDPQLKLKLDFVMQAEAAAVPDIRGRARRGRAASDVPDESLRARREATTLDRVHAAMLLQAAGKSNALRALLKAEVDRSPDFLRLANALSALYPPGSDEKRLIDAMFYAVPR